MSRMGWLVVGQGRRCKGTMIYNQGDIKFLEFGEGSIFGVVTSLPETPEMLNVVAFGRTSGKYEVGELIHEYIGKDVLSLDTHVVMIFNKIESLDALIENLSLMRESMLRHQQDAG